MSFSQISNYYFFYYCFVYHFLERHFVSWTISILLNNNAINGTHCTSIPHRLVSIPIKNYMKNDINMALPWNIWSDTFSFDNFGIFTYYNGQIWNKYNDKGRQNLFFFFTLCQNVKCLLILSLILKVCNVGSMLLFLSASTENYVTFQRSFRTGIH